MNARAGSRLLLLRWSLRDLRARWLLVGAIALILALGTGTFAGLGSTAEWRRQSNDASFGLLRMHDIRLSLAQGATVDAGRLAAAAATIPQAGRLAGVEERLTGTTQVDASRDGQTVLVPGEIVGVDVREPQAVDMLHAANGRALTADDDGKPVALLEQQFADRYDLPASGSIEISGGTRVEYVGTGTSPQYFIVTGRAGGLFAQGSLAVIFVPMGTAQALLGQPGAVNELVVRVEEGSDTRAIAQELIDALAEQLPEIGATATLRADEAAYRMLYEDIDNDQQFWNIVAGLVLAGATFAAFNLTTRMVEAQRREIGIGMALGVTPRRLARRPLLVGFQIASLGVLAGIVTGYVLDLWLKQVFESLLPLPVWRTPFQPGVFLRAAALGFALPIIATAIPVWRAVRVQPVDAIRVGHLAARGSGLAPILARVSLPGRTYRQMPFRNLLRTPRRTLLTALAIGAAITTLIAVVGIVDSFVRTIDRGEAEMAKDTPDRLVVELGTFLPAASENVAAIGRSPAVAESRPTLRLFGNLSNGGDDIDVLTDLVDFDNGLWQPTLRRGTVDAVRDGGIVLSEKAARDLGVDVGDTLQFEHPRRQGLSYRLVTSEVRVGAVHAGPMRAMAYLDLGQAELFDLQGLTNLVEVKPAAGVTQDEAKRAVFSLDGVASVESVTASTEQFREMLDQYFGVLRIAEVIVLALALLIAFNSTSISIDERAREHATMLAFGLRARTVLGMATVESMVAGAIGTAAGVLGGYGVVQWMMRVQLQDTMPDLDVYGYVSPTTLVTAVLVGILAVGLAPVLAARRVTKTDIPSTLRVME